MKNRCVVIIGAGGTGCQIIPLLYRQDFNISVVDRDIVEKSNLRRQLLYSENDVGKPKVLVVKKKFPKINAYFEDLNPLTIKLLKDSVLVIDCTDNIETRLLINDYCKKNNIPWIYTGAIGSFGSIYFVNSKNKKSACFRCFNDKKYGETCNDRGVELSVLKKTGEIAAGIAENYLLDGIIEDSLIRINTKNNSVLKIHVKKNPKCKACSGNYRQLSSRRIFIRYCENKFFISLDKRVDLNKLEKKLNAEDIQSSYFGSNCLIFNDFVVYDSGKIIVKAKSVEDAQKKFYAVF